MTQYGDTARHFTARVNLQRGRQINRIALSFVELALAAAPPAVIAQEKSASAPEAQSRSQEQGPKEAKEADDPVICREQKVIGSLAKKRNVCLALSEWKRVAREGNAFARSVVESGRSGTWHVPPE